MGFTFDDGDTKGVANPVSDMKAVIERNPKNAERIFPFIGGEELNENPTQTNSRYIINFGDMEESQARSDYPELMRIVEARVKPERQKVGLKLSSDQAKRAERWWQYSRTAKELYDTVRQHKQVLVLSQVTAQFAFGFLPADWVYSHALNVFAFQDESAFAVLQSRVHELWVRFFGSSLEDRLRYTPSDCFETFPFPAGFETNTALDAAGREYYEFRAALLQDLWLGLTEIYNLFHSPDDEALARLEAFYRKRAATPDWRTAEAVPADRSPLTLYATPAAALAAVQRLRVLHAAMDTAVLTAYGWSDLLPKCTCEFLLDYEEDEADEGESTGRRKKKPWRYRWPDETRDEVLARLLKLNAERAEEERLAGLAAGAAKPKGKPAPGAKRGEKAKPTPGITSHQADLIPPEQGDFFT
jgi:hypothetical protein